MQPSARAEPDCDCNCYCDQVKLVRVHASALAWVSVTQRNASVQPCQQQDVMQAAVLALSLCRERYSGGDRGCDDVIYPGVSGYCLCEGNVTTSRCAKQQAPRMLCAR